VVLMKSIAFLPVLLILVAGVGAIGGTFLILMNQKNVVKVNINILYNTNEPYRALDSLLNLNGTYLTISLSDFYGIPEDKKDFIIKELNKTLLGPACFKISKDGNTLLEYPSSCQDTDYNAKVPVFTPGKVEELYLNYKR